MPLSCLRCQGRASRDTSISLRCTSAPGHGYCGSMYDTFFLLLALVGIFSTPLMTVTNFSARLLPTGGRSDSAGPTAAALASFNR